MTLVQSWIDSLTLLKPKNAQLFIMVTLKSIIEVYKLLFWYWWWLIGLIVWLVIIIPGWMGQNGYTLFSWVYQLALFTACAATRPSIMKKDCAYFKSQMYALVYMAIFLFFIPKIFWPNSFSPIYIFLVLFFLDSAGGPKNFLLSLWNSLKMIVFNLPLLAVISIAFYLLALFCSYIIMPFIFYNNARFRYALLSELPDLLGILPLPIGVCLYANIYIKKLHDQFDLYFRQS